MSANYQVLALFAPLVAGALATLLRLVTGRDMRGGARLAADVAILSVACAGPVAQTLLLLFAPGAYSLPGLGLTLAPSSLTLAGVAAVDAALVCLILFPASSPEADNRGDPALATTWAASVSGTLLAGAILLNDPLAQVFCLVGASLVLAAYAAYPLPRPTQDDHSARPSYEDTLNLAGAIKHLSVACGASLLLVLGSLFLARFPLHMENASMLGAGFGLLSVGLAVRSGAMPFSGGLADLGRSNPRALVLALGAITPAALAVGATILSPVVPRLAEVPASGRQVALALGVLASFLAGLRALSASRRDLSLPLLYTATAGVSVGWALFGVLSASATGTAGAILLATNLAITVPLVASSAGRYLPATRAAAASLLGLPPLGGFAGALLVGSAAVQAGGPWLALLLVGPTLAAVASFRASPEQPSGPPTRYERLYFSMLILAQFVLLVISVPLAGILGAR